MFCTQRYSSTLLEVSMETHENDDMVVIWQSFTTCDRPTRWVRKIIQAGETDRTRQPQKSRGCRTLYVPLSQTNQERERESPISLHCVSTRAMRYGTLERREKRQAMKAILVLKLQLSSQPPPLLFIDTACPYIHCSAFHLVESDTFHFLTHLCWLAYNLPGSFRLEVCSGISCSLIL
jgi:hypothetical protein